MIDAATAVSLFEVIAATFDMEAMAVSVFEEPNGRASLELYFRDTNDEVAICKLIAATAGTQAAAAIAFEKLSVADWVRQGLAALTPVDAGRFSVHGAHDRARIRANRMAIEIEAGLAFGTGHHGTTRGCLTALDLIAKRATTRCARAPAPRTVSSETALSYRRRKRLHIQRRRESSRAAVILDIGTGTGVLAIAAAKALRRPVLASDIDARAVTVARANARLNGAVRFIEVIRADGVLRHRFRQRGRYQLIFANILLAPLQALATPIGRLVAPGGAVVLSGLLVGQEVAALASYRARGFALAHRIRLDGWVTLVLRRP